MANNGSDHREHNVRLRGILKHDVEVMKSHDEQRGHGSQNQPGTQAPRSSKPKAKHGAIKFDELNITETFHPVDKDYGLIKIDEPKTPFAQPIVANSVGVNPGELMSKLTNLAKGQEDQGKGQQRQTEVPETAGFRDARKQHYKEFSGVDEAKKLIALEFGEEDAAGKK